MTSPRPAHTWHKLGHVFDPRDHPGRPWLAEFAQAPSAVVLEDTVRIYFSCRPRPDERGQYVSRSAWVDLDRADLTRVVRVADEPVLPLGGVGEFDEFGTYPISVMPYADGYRAYYAGWTRCESVPFNVGIGMATSTDGVRFERYGRGPILPYTPDEPFVLSGPKIRRFATDGTSDGTSERWHLFYIAGRLWKHVDGRPEPVYRIRRAVSEDGLTWQKAGVDLIEPRVEADEAQASPDVIWRNGAFHMFFSYRHSANYRGHDFGYRIGYARSTDLTTWERDDARAGIDVGTEGWDAEMISYPHVFDVDGTTYMAYLGNGVGRHGFGLARLEGELG